jgi:hypothetical protein
LCPSSSSAEPLEPPRARSRVPRAAPFKRAVTQASPRSLSVTRGRAACQVRLGGVERVHVIRDEPKVQSLRWCAETPALTAPTPAHCCQPCQHCPRIGINNTDAHGSRCSPCSVALPHNGCHETRPRRSAACTGDITVVKEKLMELIDERDLPEVPMPPSPESGGSASGLCAANDPRGQRRPPAHL